MSEDSKTNKVTAVEKSEKAKDPKKVELGKRLAKISKEAKERKARQREQLERSEENEEINNYIDFRYFVGGVTIVAALGGLYYAYKSDKRLDRERSSEGLRTRGSSERKSERESDRDRPEDPESKILSSDEVLRTAGPAQQRKDKKVKTINKNDYEITKCNRPSGSSDKVLRTAGPAPKVQPSRFAAATSCSIENL